MGWFGLLSLFVLVAFSNGQKKPFKPLRIWEQNHPAGPETVRDGISNDLHFFCTCLALSFHAVDI